MKEDGLKLHNEKFNKNNNRQREGAQNMNVAIRDTAVYYPENIVNNDYYLKHFAAMGKNESEFYETIGQNERKIIPNDSETTITLAIKAVAKLLTKNELNGSDIDLVIFTSQFPEMLIPSQAMAIHHAFDMKSSCLTFDLNANCVGMVVGLETANLYMRQFHLSRAIVIGADYMSKHSRDDSTVYSFFGDIGCATLLELEEGEDHWIASTFTSNSVDYDIGGFPACGMASIYRNTIAKNDKKFTIYHADTVDRKDLGIKDIDALLKQAGLVPDDVDLYCVSQATKKNVTDLRDYFMVSEQRMPYIGDIFGYTGTSSPFLVLDQYLQAGKIKHGDNIVLWSIGMAYQSFGLLIKF